MAQPLLLSGSSDFSACAVADDPAAISTLALTRPLWHQAPSFCLRSAHFVRRAGSQ